MYGVKWLAATTGLLLAFPLSAQASTEHWQMNEKKGHVLHDSSRNQQDGRIGRLVNLNGRSHGFKPIAKGIYKPGRIDIVPNSPRLNPGGKFFAVTAEFKWIGNDDDNNIIQKGQGSPVGGMFKMKTSVGSQPDGAIKCLFRGSIGDSQVESYGYKRLDDGKWHTVKCTRRSNGTFMRVDGNMVDHNPKKPGVIDNTWNIAIAGNQYCNAPDLECNYWHGRIGDIKWQVGH